MIRSAVLLAAGRGLRLRPFTDELPKSLLQVNGRATLDYILAAVSHAGIERVCMVTNHLEEKIFDFVGDGSKWNLDVTFAHQNELRGSSDALMSVPSEWIRDEPVMVTATAARQFEMLYAPTKRLDMPTRKPGPTALNTKPDGVCFTSIA